MADMSHGSQFNLSNHKPYPKGGEHVPANRAHRCAFCVKEDALPTAYLHDTAMMPFHEWRDFRTFRADEARAEKKAVRIV